MGCLQLGLPSCSVLRLNCSSGRDSLLAIPDPMQVSSPQGNLLFLPVTYLLCRLSGALWNSSKHLGLRLIQPALSNCLPNRRLKKRIEEALPVMASKKPFRSSLEVTALILHLVMAFGMRLHVLLSELASASLHFFFFPSGRRLLGLWKMKSSLSPVVGVWSVVLCWGWWY